MEHPQMFDDDDAWLGRLREVCGRYPGCFEKVAHGRPTFRAGEKGKVFAYFGGGVKTAPGVPHEQHDAALIFYPDPAEVVAIDSDERFWVPAYLGPSGWRGLDLDGEDLDWAEIAELVDASYRQVAARALVTQLDAG